MYDNHNRGRQILCANYSVLKIERTQQDFAIVYFGIQRDYSSSKFILLDSRRDA